MAIVTALVVLYSGAIYWIYTGEDIRRFVGLGYTYVEPNWGYLVLLTLALAFMAMTLPRRIDHVSSFVLWLLFALVVVPGVQVTQYSGYLSPENGFIAASGLIGSFAIARLITLRHRPPRFLGFALPPRIFWSCIALFSVFVFVVLQLTLGLELRFLNVLDVYEVRGEYNEKLLGASAAVSYLVGTQSNVVNPLIIARGIVTKNYAVIALGVLGQVLIYSATGFKTILFSVPAVVLFSVIFIARGTPKGFDFSRRPKSAVFLWAPTALIVACVVIDQLTNTFIWTSFFGRRFIVTPGLMTGIYVKYYSENPLALLDQSVLGPWVDSGYEFPPAQTIGLWVTGTTDSAMNSHLFADGFANFGWVGMAAAGVVLGIYLRLSDRAAVGLPPVVPSLLLIMLTITLSNTSILTSMFSHGLVAAFMILTIAPRDGWHPPPERRTWREFGAALILRTKRPPQPVRREL